MAYLVDTNVVSEVCKPSPSEKVAAWLELNSKSLFLSSITIEEMRFGQLMMPKGKKKDKLGAMINSLLNNYSDSTLAFGAKEAELCALLHHQAIYAGRSPSIEDLMIASIAQANNLVLATRNTKDFDYLGIDIVNPFEI